MNTTKNRNYPLPVITDTDKVRDSITSISNISDEKSATDQDGYLSSEDWNTFNGKQDTMSSSDPISLSDGTIGLKYDTDDFELDKSGNLVAKGGGGVTDHGALTGLADDDHTQYLLANATRILSADWDIGDTRSIKADTIKARDGAGLQLQDDGSNGIFIKDGGNIGIANTNPSYKLSVGTSEYISMDATGGLRTSGFARRVRLWDIEETSRVWWDSYNGDYNYSIFILNPLNDSGRVIFQNDTFPTGVVLEFINIHATRSVLMSICDNDLPADYSLRPKEYLRIVFDGSLWRVLQRNSINMGKYDTVQFGKLYNPSHTTINDPFTENMTVQIGVDNVIVNPDATRIVYFSTSFLDNSYVIVTNISSTYSLTGDVSNAPGETQSWMKSNGTWSMVDSYQNNLGKGSNVEFNTIKTGEVQPKTDNTYYIGKNDDDSPLAYKGVILKDTTNGKYYRIEITNGAIVATDLTD
jgi:hypothetical protein